MRITYRLDGQVSKQELGTVNSQSDADWANFDPAEVVDLGYDTNSRVTSQKLTSDAGSAYALTQLSHDALGRPECSAVRMDTATYGSLPASACTLSAANPPDRITKVVYNAAGEVTENRVAVGTGIEAAERTLSYTPNGLLATLLDAANNLTTYEYDGFDRLSKTLYPVVTKGANQSNPDDYEQLTYDAASNVTTRRTRANQTIGFSYDALNRPTLKDAPGTEPDVTYAWDNFGRLTSAAQTGNSLSLTYDALSRNLTQQGQHGTVTSEWDVAGRRTKLTYPGTGLYVNYDYLVTGETTKIREKGATSGVGVLATYAYDDLGRRTSVTFGNGVVQSFSFDPASRLSQLTNSLPDPANNLTATFAYNPASQITSTTRTGDAYAWTGHFNEDKTGTANGLNQLTQYGARALSHDANGNVTAFGTKGFTYSSENLLLTGPNGTTLSYDPVMRLSQLQSGTPITKFTYDGLDRVAEHGRFGGIQRRYVHGPGIDEPIVWYEGTGTSGRRFLSADERGSIVSVTDSTGALLGINKYDEFGQPQGPSGAGTLLGKFGYTGQAWLPEIGEWHYKARVYDPELGRFLQPDPIGYADSPNLYAYVLNDPVNLIDPTGLAWVVVCVGTHGSGGGGPVDWSCGYRWVTEYLGSPAERRWAGTGRERIGGVLGDDARRTQQERQRRCNAIQRALEKAGDAAADWAALGFDAGMGSWIGGLGASGSARLTGNSVLGRTGELLTGPIRIHLFRFAGMAAAVSLGSYFLSGQPVGATAKKGIEAAVNRALKKYKGPGGEKLKDEITSELQNEFDKNRCIQQ